MRMKLVGLLALCVVAFPLWASELHVHVRSTEVESGDLVWSLFDQQGSSGFPLQAKAAVRVGRAALQEGRAEISIKNLSAGSYAVFVFLDRNGNGAIDHKWYGPPAELFGYYRDYQPFMGPPAFKDVAFDLGNDSMSVDINLQHF